MMVHGGCSGCNSGGGGGGCLGSTTPPIPLPGHHELYYQQTDCAPVKNKHLVNIT